MEHTNYSNQTNYRPVMSNHQQSSTSWILPPSQSIASHNTVHNYQNAHQSWSERPMSPPDKRGAITDSPTTFTIVVDVHDFNPEEISVQIVDNASAAIVKGEHGRPKELHNHEVSHMMLQAGEIHSESRSFTERYSLPADLNMGTFMWDFPDKNHLRIVAQKVGQVANPAGHTLQQAITQRQQQQQPQQMTQKPTTYYYPNGGSSSFLRYFGNNGQLIPTGNNFTRNGFQRYGFVGNHSGHQHDFTR